MFVDCYVLWLRDEVMRRFWQQQRRIGTSIISVASKSRLSLSELPDATTSPSSLLPLPLHHMLCFSGAYHASAAWEHLIPISSALPIKPIIIALVLVTRLINFGCPRRRRNRRRDFGAAVLFAAALPPLDSRWYRSWLAGLGAAAGSMALD